MLEFLEINVFIKYGFQGPLMNVDTACATAAHSIGSAFHMIRHGILQVAVTGASDCPFSPAVVEAWMALRAVSTSEDCPAEACRPFSADRDGMVLGEGAGILVLEAESHALRRGAPILAEIKGYGATSDSYHLTQPSQQGPVRAMRRALEDAELDLHEIDYINAHATGALELIGCILSLCNQIVPPTINYKMADPECDLDYVTEGSRKLRLQNIMSNSFAFGGSNAVLIAGTYEPEK